MRADLHIHTSASDGLKTPREAAEHMHGLGVELISVTDHDTVSGLDEAAEECRALGVHFVPGIEISAHSNSEIHILGYNIDYKNPDFCEQIAKVKDMRRARNLLIGEKLAGYGVELGIDFSSDGLGRMNIARLMVEKGYAKDVQDAFNRYLGPNGKAYSDVRRTSPLEAVKLIAAFGGVPVLAHPKKYLQQKTLRLLVEGLGPFGLKGIEVYYPTHTADDVAALSAVADRYGLIRTGGSDYHGEEDKPLDYRPSSATLKALGCCCRAQGG